MDFLPFWSFLGRRWGMVPRPIMYIPTAYSVLFEACSPTECTYSVSRDGNGRAARPFPSRETEYKLSVGLLGLGRWLVSPPYFQ